MKRKGLALGVVIASGVVVLSLIAAVGLLSHSGNFAAPVAQLFGKAPIATEGVQAPGGKKRSFVTCSMVRDRTRDFLKLHYSYRSFSEEISSRLYNRFFQTLDPGKNFFLQSDIDRFRSFEKTLPVALAKLDCSFIYDVQTLLMQRVSESGAYVDEVLPKVFDYGVDESIETDRRKISWASSADDLKDRWRRQFKFMGLGMRETEKQTDVMMQKMRKRHQLLQKSWSNRSRDEVSGMFLDAFALSLDPHSSFQMPEDQDEFKVQFSLQLVGIGAQLTNNDGYTVVENIIPGGPAARDGRLQKSDKIIAVDSGDGQGFTDVVDMDLNKVVQLIRGKKDTVVKLSLLRKAENGEVVKFVLELVRDVVNLPDGAAKSDVIEMNGRKVGVISLPSFYIDYQGSRSSNGNYRSSANDLAKEVMKLRSQNVDGIVLDLRRNGGGDLAECIRMTGMFIDTGSVVQVQERGGDVESLDDKQEGTLYVGPLAVLTSKQSASASEILSGALKDYGRALILGNSRTYGKATVQHVVEVPGTDGRDSDGALKVTVSKFFQPSGGSNQGRGVLADVVIPDVMDPMQVGEEYTEYYLPHTEIKPSKTFRALQDFSGILPELKRRSVKRVADSKEFRALAPLIEKATKERDNTVFPLKPEAKGDTKSSAKCTPKPGKKCPPATAATPTPSPTPGNAFEPPKVVDKDDIQLFEAAHILLDSVELLKGKKDWTK
jgi:carboxyl-terminal processing protease